MMNELAEISLGFTEKKVPQGTHMCLVFTNEQERIDSLLKFLLSGIIDGERTACFSGKVTEQNLREFFAENSISYDERKKQNAISLSDTNQVYFQDGVFDPDRMLGTLANFYDESKKLNFKGARVIGEMIPEVEKVPGGERLMEYESRVSMLLKNKPVTSVCQYDANSFDGATIMEVLKVHPKMIVNGSVVQNPFFIEPEEYLKNINK